MGAKTDLGFAVPALGACKVNEKRRQIGNHMVAYFVWTLLVVDFVQFSDEVVV